MAETVNFNGPGMVDLRIRWGLMSTNLTLKIKATSHGTWLLLNPLQKVKLFGGSVENTFISQKVKV